MRGGGRFRARHVIFRRIFIYGKSLFCCRKRARRNSDDAGLSLEKYASFQHSAHAFSAFAGAFQYGGCGCRRQILKRGSFGSRRFHNDSRFSFHRLSHRNGKCRQCSGCASSRRKRQGAHIRFHTHLVCDMSGNRLYHNGALPCFRAVHAGTARHKG